MLKTGRTGEGRSGKKWGQKHVSDAERNDIPGTARKTGIDVREGVAAR